MSARPVTAAGVAVLASVLVSVLAPGAYAQTRSVSEAISVPDGIECLEHAALSDAVVGWLERGEVDDRLSLLVEASAEAPRAVGFVVLDGEQPLASRRFAALPAPCPDRRAALSLAIAIAIDATVLNGLLPERHDPEPTEPEPAPPELTPATDAPAVGQERDADTGVHVGLALTGSVPVGLLPDAVVGAELAVELELGLLTLRAGVLGTAIDEADVGRGSAGVQLVAGRLDACLHNEVAPLRLDGCLGIGAGFAFAEGSGFSEPLSARLGWVAAIGRLAVTIPSASVLAARIGLDAHVPLLRPQLDVLARNREVLASRSFPAVGITPSLGVFLRFR